MIFFRGKGSLKQKFRLIAQKQKAVLWLVKRPKGKFYKQIFLADKIHTFKAEKKIIALKMKGVLAEFFINLGKFFWRKI